MENKLNQLKAISAEIADLGAASALLGWDQETMMPPKGAADRAALVPVADEQDDETGRAPECVPDGFDTLGELCTNGRRNGFAVD